MILTPSLLIPSSKHHRDKQASRNRKEEEEEEEELSMADEFHGLSGSWWNSMRCGSVDGAPDSSFGWLRSPAAADGNVGRSFDNSPASCLTFQEPHNVQTTSDQMLSMAAMDSSLQLSISGLSSSSVDHWAQSFITAENSEPYSNLKNISHGFLTIDPSSSEAAMNNIPLFSPCGFSLLDNLLGFEAESQQQSNFSSKINIITCSNESSDFCSTIRPLQYTDTTGFQEKTGLNKSTAKINSEETISSSNSSRSKKPRIETPSPLPTFKVRKEKLGDRITALQQLVSPFGKTDTASVLYEAIEYIKFLHEQVRTLSSPYLRNSSQINHQQSSERTKDGESRKQQLRSRGLCLVPISSTFAVACSEIPPIDFWNPAFGMINYT